VLVDALSPISMTTAADHVAGRLATSIALGHFAPGEHLPSERDLAVRLEVSRSSVREGIQKLAALGYVSVRRGRTGGTVVESSWGPEGDAMVRRVLVPDWDRMQHLLDAHRLIESDISATAARRRTDEHVEALRVALARCLATVDDAEDRQAAGNEFRDLLIEAAGNPALGDIADGLRHDISLGMDLDPLVPEARDLGLAHLPELVDAIEAHDEDTARFITDRFFADNGRRMHKLLVSVTTGDAEPTLRLAT
jgi:GntR family transcriptional regulator, transcriptional repressor for pyruvate dehydrogenase complex